MTLKARVSHARLFCTISSSGFSTGVPLEYIARIVEQYYPPMPADATVQASICPFHRQCSEISLEADPSNNIALRGTVVASETTFP